MNTIQIIALAIAFMAGAGAIAESIRQTKGIR